jgi:formylglycine-generating enzyme required for sulfatase activity
MNPNRSPSGARGLAGNVLEWTSSRWQDTGFGETINQEGAKMINNNAFLSWRGGTFDYDRNGVRCAYRDGFNAWDGLVYQGFRCVRDVK